MIAPDLIFLENTDVIFRVALALLTYHKDKLLACDGFEEIMNYLKTKVPAFDKVTLDKIMKQVSEFFWKTIKYSTFFVYDIYTFILQPLKTKPLIIENQILGPWADFMFLLNVFCF